MSNGIKANWKETKNGYNFYVNGKCQSMYPANVTEEYRNQLENAVKGCTDMTMEVWQVMAQYSNNYNNKTGGLR